MKPTELEPRQGRLLISEPSLRDLYFKRSVVLLADHNKEGSFGLILNKPVDVKLNKIIKDFPGFEAKVYLGGPVKTDSLFVLHTLGDVIENSMEIMNGLYWGGNMDTIMELASNDKIDPSRIRFYVGYSGWGEKQLDDELKENSWFVAIPNIQEILKKRPDAMWPDLMRNLGKEYAIWANYPADPVLN